MSDSGARRRRYGLFAFGVLGLLVLAGIASNAEQFPTGTDRPAVRDVLPIEKDALDRSADFEEPRTPVEVPESAVNVIAIVALVGVVFLLLRQRVRIRLRWLFKLPFWRPSLRFKADHEAIVTEEERAEEIAEFTRDLIDELNDGDTPRFAIQRAYAAVETGFGAKQLARKPAETPLTYLRRIFGQHASIKAPLEQLTSLFQHARYSKEPVSEHMRHEAIEALREIRDHYTSVAWKKIAKLERAR